MQLCCHILHWCRPNF